MTLHLPVPNEAPVPNAAPQPTPDVLAAPRLNLGSGPVAVPGWVNIDRSPSAVLDRLRPLKRALYRVGVLSDAHMTGWSREVVRGDIRALDYGDATVGAIYSSHTLEHLYYREAEQVIAECFRVLLPGGVLRLALPDAEQLAREFADRARAGDAAAALEFNRKLNAHPLARPGRVARVRAAAGGNIHRWQPSPALVQHMLAAAGFTTITHCTYRDGRCPGLGEVETRPNSFFLEALR